MGILLEGLCVLYVGIGSFTEEEKILESPLTRSPSGGEDENGGRHKMNVDISNVNLESA